MRDATREERECVDKHIENISEPTGINFWQLFEKKELNVMGMYTGLRFKGIVKEKFRKDFALIALNGNWNESSVEEFLRFSDNARASFIPCGTLAYMPDEWEQEPYNKYGDGVATDGFVRTWDENTGYWSFQCSLKNYENTIEEFIELLPYFIESVEHCEVFYEEWRWSKKYELIDGKMKLTDYKFIEYNKYSDWE